jgi:hypothetical protein
MLHPYIHVVQQTTDDDGWLYRSQWNTDAQMMSQSQSMSSVANEPWSDTSEPDKLVRRRLWMTTVVKKDDFLKAKRLFSEWLDKPRDDAVYQDTVSFCQLTGSSGGDDENNMRTASWEDCRALLYHHKLEFYNGQDKKGDAILSDCEVS